MCRQQSLLVQIAGTEKTVVDRGTAGPQWLLEAEQTVDSLADTDRWIRGYVVPPPHVIPLARGGPIAPPADAPPGYSLAAYSRFIGKNGLIRNGISFSYLDPRLGEMGAGDLKAAVILKGRALKGRLTIQWLIDGTVMHAQTATPNSVSELPPEPVRGSYRIVLTVGKNQVAQCAFSIGK